MTKDGAGSEPPVPVQAASRPFLTGTGKAYSKWARVQGEKERGGIVDQWEIEQRENQRALVRDAVRQVLAEQTPADDALRKVVLEAIQEWMSDRIREFGWLSLKTLGYVAFGVLVYLAMMTKGWTPPTK